MTNREHSAPDPELMDFALQARELLDRQTGQLQEEQIHENRLWGIQVFEGKHLGGWQSANRLQVFDGSLRNRFTQSEVAEHKLVMHGTYGQGGQVTAAGCIPSWAVTFSAQADLLTGEAKYSSESTVMWLSRAKVDRNSKAWRFIIPHLTHLNDFFRGKYDGPDRLS